MTTKTYDVIYPDVVACTEITTGSIARSAEELVADLAEDLDGKMKSTRLVRPDHTKYAYDQIARN